MSYFACTYVYGPAEEQAKFRPAHRAYLGELVEAGQLAASGPFVGEDDPGALLLFIGQSTEEVEELIAHDPMHQGGAVLSYTVREWSPVMGSVGPQN